MSLPAPESEKVHCSITWEVHRSSNQRKQTVQEQKNFLVCSMVATSGNDCSFRHTHTHTHTHTHAHTPTHTELHLNEMPETDCHLPTEGALTLGNPNCAQALLTPKVLRCCCGSLVVCLLCSASPPSFLPHLLLPCGGVAAAAASAAAAAAAAAQVLEM